MQKFIYNGNKWEEKIYPEKNIFYRYKNVLQNKLKLEKDIRKEKKLSKKITKSLNSGVAGYNKSLKLVKKLSDSYDFFSYLRFSKKLSIENFPTFYKSGFFQFYSNKNKNPNKKLLLCFTGDTGQLNMPIPVFHSLAIGYFDTIAYFFCPQKDRYNKNFYNVMKAVNLLIAHRKWGKISLLGTSGGGTIPLKLNNIKNNSKKLVTSPPFLEDPVILSYVNKKNYSIFNNSRIFYSAAHKFDFKHYKYITNNLPKEICANSIFNLSFYRNRHDTLNVLLLLGELNNQLQWLGD